MAKFKVGDKVRRKVPIDELTADRVCVVAAAHDSGWLGLEGVRNSLSVWHEDYFEPAVQALPGMILSTDPAERKATPITTGVLDYFPRALAAVAQCSKAGNEQHHPGQPLHWEFNKSADHADCIARHLIDRRSLDTDGIPHISKLAWRALALLETELRNQETQGAGAA